MGSVGGYSVCPQCGAAMHYECWYNSGSNSYTCGICGFDGTKMIHYETRLPRNDKSIDVDGYFRNATPGHGVVSTCRHSLFNNKKTDDATIPLDEDDGLYYETWVENGRLKKIKVTQEGLSHLMAGMHIVILNGETYLAADEDCRLQSSSAKSAYSDVTLPEGVLNKAREREHILYLHGFDAFLSAMDSAVGCGGRFDSPYDFLGPHLSPFGQELDEKAIAEAREKFMAEYTEANGEDFDFEKYINHKVDCPTYGFDNNICTGHGLKVDIDMSEVHEHWGLKSKVSGAIECYSTRMRAFSQLLYMLDDFHRFEMDYGHINDYSIIHFKDGVEMETAMFKFVEYDNEDKTD